MVRHRRRNRLTRRSRRLLPLARPWTSDSPFRTWTSPRQFSPQALSQCRQNLKLPNLGALVGMPLALPKLRPIYSSLLQTPPSKEMGSRHTSHSRCVYLRRPSSATELLRCLGCTSVFTRLQVVTKTSLPQYQFGQFSVTRRFRDFDWLHAQYQARRESGAVPLALRKSDVSEMVSTLFRDIVWLVVGEAAGAA